MTVGDASESKITCAQIDKRESREWLSFPVRTKSTGGALFSKSNTSGQSFLLYLYFSKTLSF